MAEFQLGRLATSRGYRLQGFDEIDSTSTRASAAASAGDAGEVWYAALRQTAGRGRRGRPWQSPSGNLAASLLILPECEPALAATMGFVAGVALNRALADVMPALVTRQALDGVDGEKQRITLKWPNDVLADGAKLAGILLEAQRRPDGRTAVVVGFGVNVVEAPQGLPYPATYLGALDPSITAERLFEALAEEWVVAYELWDQGRNVADILTIWRSAAAGIGGEVAVNGDTGVVRGIFESIDESGRLIVRANDNSRIAISAGDVHFGVAASVRA